MIKHHKFYTRIDARGLALKLARKLARKRVKEKKSGQTLGAQQKTCFRASILHLLTHLFVHFRALKIPVFLIPSGRIEYASKCTLHTWSSLSLGALGFVRLRRLPHQANYIHLAF